MKYEEIKNLARIGQLWESQTWEKNIGLILKIRERPDIMSGEEGNVLMFWIFNVNYKQTEWWNCRFRQKSLKLLADL